MLKPGKQHTWRQQHIRTAAHWSWQPSDKSCLHHTHTRACRSGGGTQSSCNGGLGLGDPSMGQDPAPEWPCGQSADPVDRDQSPTRRGQCQATPTHSDLFQHAWITAKSTVSQLVHCRGHSFPFHPRVSPLQLESSFVCSVASLNLFPDP